MKASTLVRGLIICVCGLLLYRSGRMAVADAASVACLSCAIRLEPASELYVAREALARDQAGEGSMPVEAELRRALAMNPRDSTVLRSLGVHAELRGEPGEAERYFLRAVAVDHTFQPQWALANFYLRAGRMDQFWPAIRDTLAIIEPKSADPRVVAPEPVFDLCWNVTARSEEILAQIPPGKGILLPYIRYLLRKGRDDAVVDALPKVLAIPLTGADVAILTDVCDFLIGKERTTPAVLVWNHLVDHGLIHSTRLNPEQVQSIENPAFAFPVFNRAFGWKIPHQEKIFVSTGEHFLAFELASAEPEHFELLSKVLPVLPGRNYRLSWHVDASRLETRHPADSGLRLHLVGPHGELPASCPSLLSTTLHSCSFTAPAGVSQIELTLRYDRPLGAVTPEGILRLTNFGLELRL